MPDLADSPTRPQNPIQQARAEAKSFAQTDPLYYQRLYNKYVSDIQVRDGNLLRAELDQKVALEALKLHPVEIVKSILQQSFAARLQGDEYVQQTLAQAQGQVKESQIRDTSPERDLDH